MEGFSTDIVQATHMGRKSWGESVIYHHVSRWLPVTLLVVVSACSNSRPVPWESERAWDLRSTWDSRLYISMLDKGPKDTPEFLTLAKSKDVVERRVGLRMLKVVGDIGHLGVKEVLVDALRDSDRVIRIEALEAVGVHGLCELLPQVRHIALTGAKEDRTIQEWAVDSMGMMPGGDSMSVLKELIERNGGWARHSAFRELALLWVLEGISARGQEAFLTDNVRVEDPDKAQFVFYAMAWSNDRSYLKYVWPVLDEARARTMGGVWCREIGAMHCVRRLATYEEAKEHLEPLFRVPALGSNARFTLRSLKWKSENSK